MSKLNVKIVPLTYERYLTLTQKSSKEDKSTQCNEANEIVSECNTPTEDDILRETPFKKRGKRLLEHMSENEMKWDSCGRLVLGVETITDTHIFQLIKDVTKEEDSSIPAKPSRDFFKLLVLSNFDFKYGEFDK